MMDGSFPCISAISVLLALSCFKHVGAVQLRFNANGEFKIVQVADMHYANGATTPCLSVFQSDYDTCSDLNTTAFLTRMIEAEKPDLVVFTGDNIMQEDSSNITASLLAAFAPVIEAKIPWAAVLGDYDQELIQNRGMNRSEVMEFIVQMDFTVSQMNPDFTIGDRKTIHGFGNYNLEVAGVAGTDYENKSVLNLYMIDSGDYSFVKQLSYYDWIRPSQQAWLEQTAEKLQKAFMGEPMKQYIPAPALAFHHIPTPESFQVDEASIVGQLNETDASSTSVDSGFIATLISMGDVQAAFSGHNHVNDFCGKAAESVYLCHGGGFGYHGYGVAGWPRRSRVITAYLSKHFGSWRDVEHIQTWKRLDDANFTQIDEQTLYQYNFTGDAAYHQK